MKKQLDLAMEEMADRIEKVWNTASFILDWKADHIFFAKGTFHVTFAHLNYIGHKAESDPQIAAGLEQSFWSGPCIGRLTPIGPGFYVTRDDGSRIVGKSACADELAQDLGFQDQYQLEEWAAVNPSLWGNAYGLGLLGLGPWTTSDAYGVDCEFPTIQETLTHWRSVASRIQCVALAA